MSAPAYIRLGKRQLEMLILCCSPLSLLLTPDAVSDALVTKGLMTATRKGPRSPASISASGLRAVADAMDRGDIPPAIERMKQEAKARTQRSQAKRVRL